MASSTSNSVGSNFSSPRPSLLERNSDPHAGLSEAQTQADACVGGFLRQATDWHALAALTAGGMAYRLGRIGVMSLGSGHGIRALSFGAGLAAEVSAFEIAHRSLVGARFPRPQFTSNGTGGETPPLHPEIPNFWKWSGHGGLREGLLSSLVTFGTLKGFGRLAQGENLIVQHGSQATGMVLGHQIAFHLGGARPVGDLTTQFLHAEATNLQLGAGMAVSHALTGGRLHGIERGLDLITPSPLSPSLEGSARHGGDAMGGRRSGEGLTRRLEPAFAAASVAEKGRTFFPSQLWMEGDENGGGPPASGIRIDEVWLRGTLEGFPRLRKELERMPVSTKEKAELLKKLAQTVQNDARYAFEEGLGAENGYQEELNQGTSIALNGLTAALRVLRRIDWTPEEKWSLLKLFAESDEKFPDLTFVGEAYRALPKIFMAMNEAGWAPSQHRPFLEKVARTMAPLVVKALPSAIQGLHRLGWTQDEQSSLYFSWAERSGHGTDEIINVIAESVEGLTSLGWNRETIAGRLSYLFEKSYLKKGEDQDSFIDYSDYYLGLLNKSLSLQKKWGWAPDRSSHILELLFEKSRTQDVDVFKLLYSVEFAKKLHLDGEQAHELLLTLIGHQARIDGFMLAADGLKTSDFSRPQRHQILLGLAQNPDFNDACRLLPHILKESRGLGWDREQRFQILSLTIERSGKELGTLFREILPIYFESLKKVPWDAEQRYLFLYGLLNTHDLSAPSQLKVEATRFSMSAGSFRNDPSSN